jgi:hypothetical protein
MLHALKAFTIDAPAGRLSVAEAKAGLEVAYLSPVPLTFTQTDGFTPPPTREFPNIWHLEAGTQEKRRELGVVTVLVPHRAGQAATWQARRREGKDGPTVDIEIGGRRHSISFPGPGTDRAVEVRLAAN